MAANKKTTNDINLQKDNHQDEAINKTIEIQSSIERRKEEISKRAEFLSSQLKEKIGYETVTELDEDLNPTGNVFAAYTREPHPISLVKAMDLLLAKRNFEAGYMLFQVVVLKDEGTTDKILIDDHKYMVGLCGRIGSQLNVILPDIKKK